MDGFSGGSGILTELGFGSPFDVLSGPLRPGELGVNGNCPFRADVRAEKRDYERALGGLGDERGGDLALTRDRLSLRS